MHLSEFVYTVLLKPAPLRRAANALIKAMLPRTVSVSGSVICINPDDPVVSGALTLRVYEKAEIAFFRRHFRKDMTFIDVGANVGLYTALAMATPDFRGKIIAVEPHGESRRNLTADRRRQGPDGPRHRRRRPPCGLRLHREPQ